jgi:hypothetical protein
MKQFAEIIQDIITRYRTRIDPSTSSDHRLELINDMRDELTAMKSIWESISDIPFSDLVTQKV